ncbi:NAD(P)-dependent oxidoreductase [Spirosoma radiotolerans]|uniref:NAD(P)-binding domain-containing protein n=1 Tax=Spirosoma radiotolerans TaxID=1379870 RepID=A0A0E3ZRZ8_9BACT|nr:SDR family oxidoreductase [Spirosoma radiotolerans]AKD53878.1 hypothetical protein SD10_02135 [Spirosoma radiotolerans]
MNIAIFGANGGTGSELVKQALERGHQVTAIVRKPESYRLTHERLRVTAGDAMKPDTFTQALKQQNAVISALGVSSFRESLKPMTFHRETAHNIIEQMKRQGVSRLVCLTSVGVLDKPIGPLFYLWLIKPLLKHKYEDMRQLEKTVRHSGLDWTIVRPFRLTDGPRTGQYRVAANGVLDDAGSIARSDIADFILNQLDIPQYVHKTPAIGY